MAKIRCCLSKGGVLKLIVSSFFAMLGYLCFYGWILPSADFEDANNTEVVLGDGENMTLNCRVFLKQEKTVSTAILLLTSRIVL